MGERGRLDNEVNYIKRKANVLLSYNDRAVGINVAIIKGYHKTFVHIYIYIYIYCGQSGLGMDPHFYNERGTKLEIEHVRHIM
jgi:hypothetical protein